MRTADRLLPFAGTEEELERYLHEFTRLVGGMAGRHPGREGGWVATGGALLSSNPNTVPWRIRIRREGDGLTLASEFRCLPWTRLKRRRLAAYREGQLADYLTARVRGSGPESFRPLAFREPFAPYGTGVPALTAAFAWLILTGLATFAGTLLVMTLGSVPFVSRSLREIADHSGALLRAGAVPLPSLAEVAATGPWTPALVFAVPIAFFFALVHGAALAACDLGSRAARLPQASFFFQAILLGVAFFPYVGGLSVAIALAVPLSAHLGSTLVWSRRRERVRDGPRPSKAVLIIAIALSASVAGAVVPRATEWKGALDRIALFRDAWLLDHAVGRAIAATYYRTTLYTAEPLKELYSSDPSRPCRAQPLAGCAKAQTIPLLRILHFTVTAPGEYADVSVGDDIRSPSVQVRPTSLTNLEDLKGALDEVSRRTFRGERLRELCALGWHAIYYAGPLAALLVAMGALAPVVRLLFRRLRPATAIFALSSCTIVATLSLVLLTSPGEDSPDLAENLADARTAVRHEAAFRASRLDSTAALADPLLKASDDEDLRVRLWAVAALGKSADPRAYAKLVERLEDPELFVRYRAAEGLGYLRDPRAVPHLLRVMRGRSWYEGNYALDALRRIHPGFY
ncbi:MAG TPA: HEAT repeat domain-containing protein [Planctomycetota bacterium]|nr:HEAT repeat domain-containing protein [Planctomycetota bacterium]